MMEIPTNPQELYALGLAALIRTLIIFFFCRSLIKTLSHIEEENRKVSKLSIWLLLVPGLSFIFNFIVVMGMSRSLKNELQDRGFDEEEQPTLVAGLIFASLSLVDLLPSIIQIPPSFFAAIAVIGFSQIFFFVQYWLKINWYRSVLEQDEEGTLGENNQDEE